LQRDAIGARMGPEEAFMIIVRNCFVAKPGSARKLAAQ
jgi:hypothetical protein